MNEHNGFKAIIPSIEPKTLNVKCNVAALFDEALPPREAITAVRQVPTFEPNKNGITASKVIAPDS